MMLHLYGWASRPIYTLVFQTRIEHAWVASISSKTGIRGVLLVKVYENPQSMSHLKIDEF